MEEDIKSAENSFELGNYKHSEKLYKKLHKESVRYEDKNDFKNRSDLSFEYFKKVTVLDSGEACFPVYDEAEDNASIITLRITNKPSGSKTFAIDNVKSAVQTFLDEYLKDNIKELMVFDWNLHNLIAEVKEIPNSNKNFKKFTDFIEGRSFELAAFMALISYILNLKISSKYAFTGVIESDGENIDIEDVDKISEKLKCLKIERPGVSKFIIPENIIHLKDKTINPYNSIEDIVKDVFKNFSKLLESSIREDESIKKFILKTIQSRSKNKQSILIFKFSHPRLIEEGFLNRIPQFFENISDKLKETERGVILDGLLPNFLAPMLVSSPSVANHIRNFIAVRSGTSTNKVYEKAIVVRANNNNISSCKVGEFIFYKSPKS